VDYQDHARNLFDCMRNETLNLGANVRAFFRPETVRLSDLEKLDGLLEGATSYMRLGEGGYKVSAENRQ